MGMFVGLVGLIGFLVFLVLLVVALIRRTNKKGKLVGLVVCLVLFFVGVSSTTAPNDSTPSTAATPSSVSQPVSSTPLPSDIPLGTDGPSEGEITSIDYIKLYDNAAEYEGKFVRIAGSISSKGTNIAGVYYMTFKEGLSGLTNSVYINLKADSANFSDYSEGDVVAVVGKVGTSVAGSLNIDDAYIDTSISDPNALMQSLVSSSYDIEVDATTLLNAYDANEVAADEMYKDKMLKVTGEIKDIGKDIVDDIYITLRDADNEYSFTSVQCYFERDSETQKVSALSKGQNITLIGRCSGESLNVALKDCVILK